MSGAAAAAPTGRLPNLFVIGSAKSGTTSLHHYLDVHPEISMAAPAGSAESRDNDAGGKEMRFFWREDWTERMDWYQAHFATMETPVRGEATPAYSAYPFHADVSGRIHSVAPQARLLYLVRDPIDRIVAHFVQRQADGDRRSFAQYMDEFDRPENPITCPSRYATQLELYLRHFDRSRLLVVDQDDLRHRRREALRRVFAFLEVEPGFWSPEFEAERNTRSEKYALTPIGKRALNRVLDPVGRRLAAERWSRARPRVRRALSRKIIARPSVEPDVRDKLVGMLAPEVERLREISGQRFESWSL